MSVVYGREIDGKLTTFGTTGYTYRNTFVLYDRATESVWYPRVRGEFNAISGRLKGRALPFLAQPEVVPLGEWLKLHPDTKVLIEH